MGAAGQVALRQAEAGDIRIPLFFLLSPRSCKNLFYPPFDWLSEPVIIGLPIIIYLGVLAIASPFVGSWVESYGSRRLFLAGLVPSVAGFLGCTVAGTIEELMLWRGLTALGYALVTIGCQEYVISNSTTTHLNKNLIAFVGIIMSATMCGTAGILAEVIVRDADRNPELLSEFTREAKDRNVDLVVTWGTSVTLGMVGAIGSVNSNDHITEIPVVFMIVADPVGAKIAADYDSSSRSNVTGTRNRVPEAVQIKAIQAYRAFKRLGLVYNRNELNSVLNANKIAALATEMGFELVSYEMPLTEDGKPNADDIPAALSLMKKADVEFVYVGSSSFLMANRDQFTLAALSVGLPVAAAYEALATKSHALVAVASRYYSVGRLAGFQAEQVSINCRQIWHRSVYTIT